MRIAITRELSPDFERCELTHMQRQPIDMDRAIQQHATYCELLKTLGCHVIQLPAGEDMPDCVFVEDPAFVLEEVAIMTRMGAESRRREGNAIEESLAPYRAIERIVAPGTIEGGDVIVIDNTIHVGRSSRSNEESQFQLATLMAPYGYGVKSV
ncbi:MAG: arginine deiminase family protein, partial [Planctomycetota bacterium]|nr:arginine deiminase family protein [Planctomycetota bacterium]